MKTTVAALAALAIIGLSTGHVGHAQAPERGRGAASAQPPAGRGRGTPPQPVFKLAQAR